MLIRRAFLGLTFAVMLTAVAVLQAATVTQNGITMTYPGYPLQGAALLSCEPGEDPRANSITLDGVPAGSSVQVMIGWSTPFLGNLTLLAPQQFASDGSSMQIPITYPLESNQWPLWNTTTNERAIQVAVFVTIITPSGLKTKFNKSWWIRCLPPPAPAQGCTPGYWRQIYPPNDQHLDSWGPTGYSPSDDFEVVFGVDASFNPTMLGDAIWLGGGHENALARHAVAALLNAAHPDVNYSYTVGQIITGVQNAYATGDFTTFKDQLDLANNAGCSLN